MVAAFGIECKFYLEAPIEILSELRLTEVKFLLSLCETRPAGCSYSELGPEEEV